MKHRRPRKDRRAREASPVEQGTLRWWAREFLEALAVRNYSPRTIKARSIYLDLLSEWCEARGLLHPVEVTKPILERYQRHLFHLRQKDGRPLSFRSQWARLLPVRAFFKWLTKQNVLLSNPASELELPRLPKQLPRNVLSASEVEAVLAAADVTTTLGLRDRTMMEVLYSTGIRRLELVGLSVFDVDAERGTLMVRQGKGRKDRVVPIGERALAWVRKYVDEARGELVRSASDTTLFLSNLGDAFEPDRVTELVRDYVDAADLGKRGACHLFRHSMATLMLEHGADIRFIQEMLGHTDLSTTQLYTQVSIKHLKAIHAATHPGAALLRERAGDEAKENADGEVLASSFAAEAAEEDGVAG